MSGRAPDPLQAQFAAIDAQIRAGKPAVAAAMLGRLRGMARGDVRVCLADAALARAANDAPREITALRRGVALTPRWPRVHVELSKALIRADQFDEAVAAVAKAVELVPNDLAVLEVAVAVANQVGAYEIAAGYLRTARRLQPGNSGIIRALAVCMFKNGRYDEAESLYRELLDGAAQNSADLVGLGDCLIQLGRNGEAAEHLERASELLPGDASIRFNLARARGETPPTQPNDLTAALFDEYSARFDKHLAGALKYRVPKRVAEIVRARCPGLAIDVLDLGCGTGLTGVYLGGVGGALVGVDLSAGMLERAGRHSIYSRLCHGDLRDELRESAAESYDAVIANDVFIYVGDVSEVIPAAFGVLRSDGALIFSCETAVDEEGDFVLRASKRYAHSRAYIERLCRGAGFACVGFEEIELRMDGNTPVHGFIAIAEKS